MRGEHGNTEEQHADLLAVDASVAGEVDGVEHRAVLPHVALEPQRVQPPREVLEGEGDLASPARDAVQLVLGQPQ